MRYRDLIEDVLLSGGWWIDDQGELEEVDRRDWHHAQIALAAFPPDDELDSDDPDDDGGDVAIAVAMDSGWIRGSYYGEQLVIRWTTPSREAKRTLLTWMRQHTKHYAEIVIEASHQLQKFTDMASAMRFVRTA